MAVAPIGSPRSVQLVPSDSEFYQRSPHIAFLTYLFKVTFESHLLDLPLKVHCKVTVNVVFYSYLFRPPDFKMIL